MSKIKFNMIKMENHAIIQFESIDRNISRKNSLRITDKVNKFSWDMRIHVSTHDRTDIKISRTQYLKVKRAKIILNPNKNYVSDRGWNARSVKKKNNELIKLKFPNNIERDSFCNSFIEFMGQKFNEVKNNK